MKIQPSKLLAAALAVCFATGVFAQSDTLTSRTDYRNQLYETNAIGTSIPQSSAIAFYSGNIGAGTNVLSTSTNLVRPNDGVVYLVESIIGQPVGMSVVPFNLSVQGSGTITPSPVVDWYQLGQVVQLIPAAGNYYAFAGWADPGGAALTNRQVIAGPVNSYTAVFTNKVALETNNIAGTIRIAPVGTPIILINGQYYSNNIVVTNVGAQVQVSIQTSFPGGTNFYTTDGVTPPGNGVGYTGPFIATAPFSIWAVGYSADLIASAVADKVSTLSVTTPGGGSVVATTSKDFYTGESFASLTGTRNPGWTFMNWGGDASGPSTNVTLAVDAAKSVQGIFGTSFNYSTNGGGSINRYPNQSLLAYGSSVQFSGVPAVGSNFVAWGGVLTGVATNPATLTVLNPTQTIGAVFVQLPPNSYALSVLVSGNGSVSRNTNANFYTNGTVVTLTANPSLDQSFINWSGDASSTNNPLAVTMNASKIITANFAPTQPVFTMGAANYEVSENAGVVSLTVSNLGTLGGSVNFATTNLTALSGSDYTATNGTLTFTNGEHAKAISVGIAEQFLVAGDKTFKVFLSDQSTGSITSPVESVVTIHYNDVVSTNGSQLVQAFPSPVPDRSASLRVTIASPPAVSGGFWRFPWELGWRSSGALVTNLIQAEYEVEFRKIAGYTTLSAPPQLVLSNAPPTDLTNQYALVGAGVTGQLTVNLGPNNPVVITNAGWRLLGETNWESPGATLSNLSPADNYLVEFKPIAGLAAPPIREVSVFANQQSLIAAYYGLPSSLPTNAALPNPLPSLSAITGSVTTNPRRPFAFNGQLQSDVGFGSGVAVRTHTVLTAAHIVFNDATLSYVDKVYWFFQKQTGELDPKPQEPRGWYVLSGYAAARTNDLTVSTNYSPGVSSPESRSADVAVLYFKEPSTAGRGGFGGYLASDAATNEWLTGSRAKLLVGYPLDGTPFGHTNIVAGKMHATATNNYLFTQQTNRVYTTPGFLSFPGNSGGPVYVLCTNGIYYPAAVYLGTVGSSSAVRAIDGDVVNLINLAELSAVFDDTGTNFTGGGVARWISGSGAAFHPGVFQVNLFPTNIVALGGAWRVQGNTNMNWISDSSLYYPTNTGAVIVEFRFVPNYSAPLPTTINLAANQTTVIDVYYDLISLTQPQLLVNGELQMTLGGTPGRVYWLQASTNLVDWTNVRQLTNGNGVLVFTNAPVTGSPVGFFRIKE